MVLGRIIVDEADRLETQPRGGDQLLGNELGGVTGADDQGGAPGVTATPAWILEPDCPGEQPRKRHGGGRQKRVDEHHRERDPVGGYVERRHYPEAYDCGEAGSYSSRHQNLLQLADAGVAPKPAVHPQIVEDEEPHWTGKQNVWENHSQVLAQPFYIFKANYECEEWRYDERQCVEQEEMPVSHPLR